MSEVLKRILENCKFTIIEPNIEFLPRGVGLGYSLSVSRPEKAILKPAIKKMKGSRESNHIAESEESSEELSRMAHILKKTKK